MRVTLMVDSRVNLGFGCVSVTAALALLVTLWPVMGQQHDEGLKARFLEEAPPQWVEYLERSRKSQGALSVSNSWTRDNVKFEASSEFKTNGKRKLLKTVTKESSKGKLKIDQEEVFAVNDRYAFTLRRKGTDSPWILTNLADLRREGIPERIVLRFEDYLRSITQELRLDLRELLSEAVQKPEFLVKYCRAVGPPGEDLVEVGFSWSRKAGDGTKVESGLLVFDPNRYWCLRSAEVESRWDRPFIGRGTQKKRMMTPDPAKLPFTRSCETENETFIENDRTPVRLSCRFQATLSQPERLPANEEFTLSAFGLPEPTEFDERAPWYIWVGFAGVVLVLAAVVLRFRTQVRNLLSWKKSSPS